MDFILKLVDLFTNAAKILAGYLPQSGADLIQIFQKIVEWALVLNIWIASHLGVNIQSFISFIGRLFLFILNYLIELIKAIAARV